MKKFKTLRNSWDIELIPFHDASLFLKDQYKNWKVLFWYEFFIVIPWKVTLPLPELFFEIQNPKMTSIERTWLALLELIDLSNVNNILKKHVKDITSKKWAERLKKNWLIPEEYLFWYNEWLKYMNWKKTDGVVALEFIFE